MKYISIVKRNWTIFTALALMTLSSAFSGPAELLSYEQLVDKSDLVVIATLTTVREAKVATAVLDQQAHGQPNTVISMEVDFEVLAVLKGSNKERRVILRYFCSPAPNKAGVDPARYAPKMRIRYLMFLQRDICGGYLPVTGQMDPDRSIKDLGCFPP